MSEQRTPAVFGSLWSDEEMAIMRRHFPHCTQAELLPMLPGRGKNAIKEKAKDMGLRKTREALVICRKANTRGKNRWSDEDEAALRLLWTTRPMAEVLAHFAGKRTLKAVHNKADYLELRRPKREISQARKAASKAAHRVQKRKRIEAKRRELLTNASALGLQRLVTCRRFKPANLSAVMATPLEAAWRGML